MTSNRFDFLEFGGEGNTPVPQEDEPVATASRNGATALPKDASAIAHPQMGGPGLDSDGLPLAQVTVTDNRGYYDFMRETQGRDGEAAITLQLAPDIVKGFRLTETIGGRGTRAGEFNYPTGVAVDPQGILYVADSYNHRVQRFTPDGGVSAIGSRGAAHRQFLSPQDVAVDEQGSFYVLEQGNNRVQKFTSSGVLCLVFGRPGHLAGELYGPTGIAVARSGLIYIADTGNARVQVFSPAGEFLGLVGVLPGARRLTSPQSIALDEMDHLYIADTFTNRVLHFDPMGRFVGELGGALHMPSGIMPRLVEPRAVAVDACGMIYIADRGDTLADGNPSTGRLQVVNRADSQVQTQIDRLRKSQGLLARPSGLALGPPTYAPRNSPPRADVYVADTMNHRVLRFVWDWR